MNIAPPNGSDIETYYDNNSLTVSIPQKPTGFLKFPIALFLGAWLVGWAIGLTAVLNAILNAPSMNGGVAFTLVWLIAWTVGGILAIAMLFLLFRPQKPETLVITRDSIAIDMGTKALQLAVYRPHLYANLMRALRRRRYFFAQGQALKTLQLHNNAGQTRLTIDVSVDRLSLAEHATDIEREWLHDLIQRFI